MINPDLSILCCPLCKGDIVEIKAIDQMTLQCENCKKIFRLKDGIPILLYQFL